MKKKNIINLIKYYSEKDDQSFKYEASEIARYFDSIGDLEISEYIMALISDANVFVPQSFEGESNFLFEMDVANEPLPLPLAISNDIKGIINAISHNVGINKYLFYGAPGTGKTESVKQVARLLDRKLLYVETSNLVDSKLGETAKNIVSMFKEINSIKSPSNYVVLIDEFDAIAMDRVNTNDLREMGRATSTILKEFERLNDKIVLIATTNLYDQFDKALIRRFDATINFNRYEREDLVEISEIIFNFYLNKFKNIKSDKRLFRKIIELYNNIPYPGDLKNTIKTTLAFSDPSNPYDYLSRLFNTIKGNVDNYSTVDLYNMGFTLREVETLTGVSKSQVYREVQVSQNE